MCMDEKPQHNQVRGQSNHGPQCPLSPPRRGPRTGFWFRGPAFVLSDRLSAIFLRFPGRNVAESRSGSAKPSPRSQKDVPGIGCLKAVRRVFFARHHSALELVYGADFSWRLICGAGPGDLGGSRGSISAKVLGKTGPKISSQTAFRYPGMDASGQELCKASHGATAGGAQCLVRTSLRPTTPASCAAAARRSTPGFFHK